MNQVNSKAFIPEEVKKGLHLDLIKHLLDYNSKSDEYFYDIHVTTDGYCTIVEWADGSYNKDVYLGEFRYVDEDHDVLKEIVFPDNHIEYLPDECENAAIREWLEENSGYELNDYGRYVYVGDEGEE